MAAATKSEIRIDKRIVPLSNIDKVLFPATGFTKGDVIDYYRKIAPVIIPYLTHRPLTLIRYPNGVDHEFFYAKRCPPGAPTWIDTVTVPSDTEEPLSYCTVDEEAALAYVANLAGIELHILLYRKEAQTRPTWLVFDLDPGPGADLATCCDIGLRFQSLLGEAGLEAYPKTSGKKGLHVYVPLNVPRATFDQTKAFAHAVAQLMESRYPTEITSIMRKTERKGKVFIDWSQNDSHKTTVCPYSLRAQSHPSVSTPLTWREVTTAAKKGDASALEFDAPDLLKRVAKKGDLFAPVLTQKQKLPKL